MTSYCGQENSNITALPAVSCRPSRVGGLTRPMQTGWWAAVVVEVLGVAMAVAAAAVQQTAPQAKRLQRVPPGTAPLGSRHAELAPGIASSRGCVCKKDGSRQSGCMRLPSGVS